MDVLLYRYTYGGGAHYVANVGCFVYIIRWMGLNVERISHQFSVCVYTNLYVGRECVHYFVYHI